MIEATLTSIASSLDRIADAVELIKMQQSEALLLARLSAVERKLDAVIDPGAPLPPPVTGAPLPPPVTGAELIERMSGAAEPSPTPEETPCTTAPPREEEPKKPAEVLDDIRRLAKTAITRGKTTEWKAILKSAGVSTLSELPEDKIPGVLSGVQALLD